MGEDHRLDPVASSELGPDVLDVGLHRRLADDELLRELRVGEPRREQAQDLAPSRIGQSRERPAELVDCHCYSPSG